MDILATYLLIGLMIGMLHQEIYVNKSTYCNQNKETRIDETFLSFFLVFGWLITLISIIIGTIFIEISKLISKEYKESREKWEEEQIESLGEEYKFTDNSDW